MCKELLLLKQIQEKGNLNSLHHCLLNKLNLKQELQVVKKMKKEMMMTSLFLELIILQTMLVYKLVMKLKNFLNISPDTNHRKLILKPNLSPSSQISFLPSEKLMLALKWVNQTVRTTKKTLVFNNWMSLL